MMRIMLVLPPESQGVLSCSKFFLLMGIVRIMESKGSSEQAHGQS